MRDDFRQTKEEHSQVSISKISPFQIPDSIRSTNPSKNMADRNLIGHFGKYQNTLCFSPQILHKHCFQFLLGLSMTPRENKKNAYAKFWGTNKEYHGIFQSGLCRFTALSPFLIVLSLACLSERYRDSKISSETTLAL